MGELDLERCFSRGGVTLYVLTRDGQKRKKLQEGRQLEKAAPAGKKLFCRWGRTFLKRSGGHHVPQTTNEQGGGG